MAMDGRFVRSPCLRFVERFAACCKTCYTRRFPFFGPCTAMVHLSSRPQPLGSVGDDTPCEDTRAGLWTVHLLSVHHVLLQGGFFICVAGTLWLNEGV